MIGHCRVTVTFPAGLSPAPERRAPAEVVVSLARRHEGTLSGECVAIGDDLTATVEFVGQYGAVDGPALVRAARFARELESVFRNMKRQKFGCGWWGRYEIGLNARMA